MGMTVSEAILKSCPFCGNTQEGVWPYDGIEIGKVNNPLCFWDSDVRGEECWYVLCPKCSVMIKRETQKGAIEAWNTRVCAGGEE